MIRMMMMTKMLLFIIHSENICLERYFVKKFINGYSQSKRDKAIAGVSFVTARGFCRC